MEWYSHGTKLEYQQLNLEVVGTTTYRAINMGPFYEKVRDYWKVFNRVLRRVRLK